MRAFFEGDKDVCVLKPIPMSKRGRKRKQTHFDRVLNGSKEEIVDELEKAIRWARKLPAKQWEMIEKSEGGLRAFIYETMGSEA